MIAPALADKEVHAAVVGDATIISICDGEFPVDLDALLDIDPGEAERLAGPLRSGAAIVPINVFLVALPDGFELVDTGAGPLAGPDVGFLQGELARLGVRCEDIQHFLLTHLHPDHCDGLLNRRNEAAFPKAEIVLHEREAAFWLDGDIAQTLPERIRRNVLAARRAILPYRDRMRRIANGPVLRDVTSMLLEGHTPGHTGWLLESCGDRLLLWGDIVHFSAVQTAHPNAGLIFDIDREMAKNTRYRLLEIAATEELAIGGAHLPHPGFGTVIRNGGAYRYAARRI